VSQKIFLLDDSVLSNIAFGIEEKDIDMDKIKLIVDKVQLTELVSSLKDGINTKIGDDAQLISGGQAQRISLARSLYHDSEVIILDEFTNQLDDNVEKKILGVISELKKEKTIIMVSHKKKPLDICDKVFEIS
jgi:HlyD family secretion protein